MATCRKKGCDNRDIAHGYQKGNYYTLDLFYHHKGRFDKNDKETRKNCSIPMKILKGKEIKESIF